MQFQIAKTQPHTGIAPNRSSISKRIKLLYQGIFHNLFTLREVEITIVEKGDQLIYRYKKDNYIRKT